MKSTVRLLAACAAFAVATPVAADVHQSSDLGFVVRHRIVVPASADEVWARLIDPAKWWSGEHSFSGNAANFTMDARAGGCFCEMLPPGEGQEGSGPRGSVEHMRIVYAERGRALRMSGGLGPLQSEAVSGALTVMIRPDEAGTAILWEYVVGGYMRFPVATIAPAVDTVIGEQVQRLGAGLGARTEPGLAPAPSISAPEVPSEATPGDQAEVPGDDSFFREMEAALDASGFDGAAAAEPAPLPPRDTSNLPPEGR